MNFQFLLEIISLTVPAFFCFVKNWFGCFPRFYVVSNISLIILLSFSWYWRKTVFLFCVFSPISSVLLIRNLELWFWMVTFIFPFSMQCVLIHSKCLIKVLRYTSVGKKYIQIFLWFLFYFTILKIFLQESHLQII